MQESLNYCLNDKFELEDINNRRIYINSEINESVIDTVVYHILRYNRMDVGIPRENRKPIWIYINSEGGSTSCGYSVISAIICSETPVYTVNLGLAASMGFLIFIAGDKRYSMLHSEFLLHDGSTYGNDSTAKMRDWIEFETTQIGKMTKDFVTSRTKIGQELYDEKYRVEWWFLNDVAKELGVVDCVVGKDCSISEIVGVDDRD